MLAYTVYAEAGGTGKTTLAANMAAAHARAELDTLVIPLDPQNANLSRLFDVDEDRDDPEADSLVSHMIGSGRGDFEELIVTEEGVDIVPEHNNLASLGDALREADLPTAEGPTKLMGGSEKWKQLHRVLVENDIPGQYDVLICDPPATEGPHLYNALSVTQTVLLAAEPSPKGRWAIEGLEELVNGLAAELETQIPVLGAIPVRFRETNLQNEVLDNIAYSVPGCIRERSALFDGAWDAQCSVFRFAGEERDRVREYESETLSKLDKIARRLEERAGVAAPSPPEPGNLDRYSAEDDSRETGGCQT